MNREEIVEAIKECLNTENQQYKDAIAIFSKHGDPRIARQILHHELAKPLAESLQRQSEFGQNPLLVRTDAGSSSLGADLIAPVLIQRAMESSPDQAIQWLEKILGTNEAEGIRVVALWGVNVDAPIEIAPDIRLVPFNELPQSSQKEKINNPYNMGLSLLRSEMMFLGAPSAALVAKIIIRPFLRRNSEEDNIKPDDRLRTHYLLNEIALALTVVGPSTPVPAIHWFQFLDAELADASFFSGSYGSTHYDMSLPMRFEKFGDFDNKLAKTIIDHYLKLQGAFRDKLKISFERLNRAMRRSNTGDKAIELAIALEVLLAGGEGEHTWKVGLRAALLSNGDTATRIHKRAVIGAIYNLRSEMVHKGHAKENITIKGEEKKLSRDVVHEGIIICAEIIRNVIMCGQIPNWHEFELMQHRNTR